MKPLYFPYTFVTRKTALEIAAFFKEFALYQPSGDAIPGEMLPLADSGLLEVRIPDDSETSRFKRVIKDFRQWGHQQRTGEEIQAAVLRSSKDPVPFFDESSLTQIVAGIRQQIKPSHKSDAMDSTFEARVFLAFAQEYDRQYEEISEELGAYKDKVKDLVDGIDAEGNNPIKAPLSGLEIRRSDPAEFMVLRRLEAWASLYHKDTADPEVLLTTHPRVLDHIKELFPSIERIHEFPCVSAGPATDETLEAWQEGLLKHLSQLAKAEWPAALDRAPQAVEADKNEANLSLTVYIIPDFMPRDCMARCLSPSHIPYGEQVPTSHMRNTIIGLIQPSNPSK